MNNCLRLLSVALIAIACSHFWCSDVVAQQSDELEAVAPQTAPSTLATPMFFETTEDLSDGSGQTTMRVIAAEPGNAMAFMSDSGGITSFGSIGSDSFSLLNNRSVQKDLELVDDQMENIRAIQKEFSKKIRDQMGDLSKDGFDSSRLAGLKDIIQNIQRQKKEEIDKLLLPHQQERLKQVALQMRMKSRGTSSALTSGEVAEKLGISEDQIQELKDRAKKLQQEIAEKTKQLKEDAKQELIDILSPVQQKKLKEMIGDEYAPDANDWRDRFPRPLKQIQESSDQ